MDNTEATKQTLNSESTNPCCDEWMKKHSNQEKARDALCQDVKLLKQRINQIEADNARLKKDHQEEQEQMNIENEDKLKEYNARVSLENEVVALKYEIATLQQKVGKDAEDGKEDVEALHACLSNREIEISKLKELLEQERKRANFENMTFEREKMKAAEIYNLLEVEKNKSVEIGKQHSKVEAKWAEEYTLLQVRLGKEINEAKMKLTSEISNLKEATKRFEVEKQKLLADTRSLASNMAKAKERIQVEKQKADQEKKRADVEMIKAEQHKKLAEDDQNKAMQAKILCDQMSHKLEENKRTIEDLKQKIHELSSQTKPNEISRVSRDNAESVKVQQLEDYLKLQKVRAKIAKKKYKLEARQHNNLQQEVARLKLSFSHYLSH